MRHKFKTYCENQHSEYEIFFPEFAMNNYFSNVEIEPFDIADFETLIGDLSHAIVIFPEAPGSFAETGYFSLHPMLSKKIILAMDAQYQSKDSFISMGPAVKINAASRFNPNIHIRYNSPLFSDVIDKIKRVPLPSQRKNLSLGKFKDQSSYEIFCIAHKLFSIMRIATIQDIIFVFKSLFGGHISDTKVKQITSILVGSNYLISVGKYGHYYANPQKKDLLTLKTGFSKDEKEVRLELLSIFNSGDVEFLHMIESINNAA